METFYKNCPLCTSKMEYKTKSTLNYSIKHNKLCRSCSAKNAAKKYPDRGWTKLNEKVKSGERLNGFANKTHSDKTKLKMSQADKSYTQTKEFRQTMSNVTSGENNPMYSKTVYDIWVKKYGKDIADIKEANRISKLSKAFSGENNPMYGKLSPFGSGNGWSGWYNGWFFRSILELSYMINVIERFNLKWESVENKQYQIKYIDYKETERTYAADFIIENKYMIEIKPKKLHNSKNVILKKEAANRWCKSHGFIYKLTECTRLTDNELVELIESNKIQLTNRYKLKYNEQFKNK